MGLNAVADQFRKWKRNTHHSREIALNYHHEYPAQYQDHNRPIEALPPPAPAKKSRKPTKQYPPSPDTFLQGIGDYTFVRQVGQGKFSRVILSYHSLTKRQVAIKIIDKRQHDYRVMSRLVREISLMEALNHPNIVQLYETYETTDSMFIVMEYVDGFNLDEFLQQNGGKLPENQARDIFRQMVAAMDYCHSRWVVHRDLKTPNILLTKDLQVKIADFGLGNRYGRRRLRTICGSMLYYSPEIINGQGYTGPEVDCWCLGVSLYRMTVGQEPFASANTVGDLRKDVTAGNFIVPPQLSIELKNTITKCMSVDKSKRTRVHLALKGDPWLFDNGRLPDIFSYGVQNAMAAVITAGEEDDLALRKKERERMKYQHIKDMEEEKRSKKAVKRTIVCHPKNPSIYFTSAVPHSPKSEDTYINSEAQRHLLLQKINEFSRQMQLSSAHKAGNKSPIRHLLRKLKQPDQTLTHLPSIPPNTSQPNVSHSPSIRKTNSNMSLSQLYQRVTKDQVHYYTFQLTPQLALQLTGVGESSAALHQSSQQEDETAMMLVIRGICDIMGITYHRDKHGRLVCVMALEDYIEDRSRSFYKLRRRDSKLVMSNQSLNTSTHLPTEHDGSQASFSRSSVGLSDMNRSSHFVNNSKFSKFKRMTSHVLSSIFPYHSSTLVVHDSRSVRHPPFPNLNGSSRFTTTSNHQRNGSSAFGQPPQPATGGEEEDGQEKKSGVVIFAIEIISLSKDLQNRIAAVKMSKLEGSSKVFRIGCGWITGVIGQNITTTTLSNQFRNLMIDNNTPDIPDFVTMTKPKLSKPKSNLSLMSPSLHSASSHIAPQKF
ncbi:Serine/threonine-protein kinase MARK2 [Choanephora cucurbitarum]|uniref:Serine/threonine-protein kinase MARK2 n=1 Tax=Choanephora cucurbitarum TaxID=101091 RepID=A0A1C7NP27_9FUNG|nr:Serine/threonine-protein kinase MARK2 [Choanephora cucurbitarum]